MNTDEFKKRITEGMQAAGVERDSLFAHAESEALDVDKAWKFGFLQGWLMCLRDVVKENADLLGPLPQTPEAKKEIYDNLGDR